jgi:mannose-6-phosphate isomerase-like protein (cupin superfamily)
MKKTLILALACLFIFTGAAFAATGQVVGDKALLDTSFDKGLLINIDDFFANHPLTPGDAARGDQVFKSPRVEVSLVTNHGPLIGLHYHATADEIVYIHKGHGEMYIGGKWVPVKAGEIHVNPRGVIHATRVTGDEDMEVIGFFTAPQAFGNDKVMLDKVPGIEGTVAVNSLLDASAKEGMLVNFDEFYANHPLKAGDATRGDSIYKSPRSEIVMVTNHGPLIGTHYHNSAEEIVLVLKGQGEMYIDGKWVAVKAGDIHINPRGVIHATRVTGDEDMQCISFFAQPQANGNDKTFVDTK